MNDTAVEQVRLVPAELVEWLTVRHYIGPGCGDTESLGACSNCFGGRPTPVEVAEAALNWVDGKRREQAKERESLCTVCRKRPLDAPGSPGLGGALCLVCIYDL